MNYPTVKHVQEVTDFKKESYAKGAIETLMWLEDGAPHKFDGLEGSFKFNMGEFITTSLNTCGTTCCIAGAIYAYSKRLNGNDHPLFGACQMDGIFEIDGLSDYSKPLYRLFYADGSGIEMEYITPQEAAITLRKYLETGEVDWSHVGQKKQDYDEYGEYDFDD